jgi:hypothetical protein
MPPDIEIWNWTFRGFETLVGNRRVVQDWFDGLPENASNEAKDTIGYLQHTPIHQWKSPHFEKLEEGLSEVRFRLGKVRYRIYGYFGPAGYRQSYTFLHGTDKKVSNDLSGKNTAKDRMAQIARREASFHEFEFEKPPHGEAK